MAPNVCNDGIDGYDAITTTINIDNTVAVDSSDGKTFRIRHYSNSSFSTTINYTQTSGYKEAKKKLKKYLEHKILLQMQSGWVNPQEINVAVKVKPKHPAVFKNFAMNSNRGN
jgi:mevalonate kinase